MSAESFSNHLATILGSGDPTSDHFVHTGERFDAPDLQRRGATSQSITAAIASCFELISTDELNTLEREWSDGCLAHHVECLLTFIVRERDEILRLAEGRVDGESLLSATQRLIVCRGTVHTRSEMLDQVTEMQRELWYCGERGDYDHARIKLEWCSKHARNWRRWRILQYLFAAERSAGQIAEKLGG